MWKVKRIHTTPFLVGLGMELTACVFVVYSSPSRRFGDYGKFLSRQRFCEKFFQNVVDKLGGVL